MKKKFTQTIDYLASLSFTVVILVALTLTTCLNITAESILLYLEGNLLQYYVVVKNIFDFFGLFNLYQSWWFDSLLVLFSINLLLCTVKRIPKTIRTLAPFRPSTDQLLPSSTHYRESFVLERVPDDFETKLRDLLSGKWSQPSTHRSKGASLFFSQKGRYAFLGFYLAHLGLLVILIGGMVSGTGYKGNAYIRAGETTDTVFVKEGNDKFMRKLDFSISLDQCEAITSTEEGSRSKSDSYRSTITLLKGKEKVLTGTLSGYSSVKYKNFRIAQFSSPEKESYVATLSITPKRTGGKSRVYTVRRYASIRVPETGHTILLKNIVSSQRISSQRPLIKASFVPAQKNINIPSIESANLEVYGEEDELLYSLPVYSSKTSFLHPQNEGYEFFLLGIEKSEPATYSTRLKISYEPGANIIWMSLCITILGFSMMFLLSHQKLWVKVEEKDGNYHLILGGWASRNQEVIKDSFDEIKELAHGPIMF